MTKTQARNFLVETVLAYLDEGGDVLALVGTDRYHVLALADALAALGHEARADKVYALGRSITYPHA